MADALKIRLMAKHSSPGPEWSRVAATGELPPGTLLAVQTEGDRIVLANVEGDFYALEDRCSHQDYPLASGELEGAELECPFHGAKFDVRTGRALQLPAVRSVRCFEVAVHDGHVYVKAT